MPHHLLADPDFVHALRERDFRVVFAMTHDSGISFNRISESPAVCAFPVTCWDSLRNPGRTPPLAAWSPTMEKIR
ncbi:hypothetical protein ACIREM_28080 [Streptomyces shenzhenensis]|uniref:hypothetical protein n=1 Tax=Streptomyces shenzhenensis TaxID=943815 RepID=UPI003825B5DC